MHTRNKRGRHPRQKRLAPISLRESSRQRRPGVDRHTKVVQPGQLRIPTPPVLPRSDARLSLQAVQAGIVSSSHRAAARHSPKQPSSHPNRARHLKGDRPFVCFVSCLLQSLRPWPDLVTNCTVAMNQHLVHLCNSGLKFRTEKRLIWLESAAQFVRFAWFRWFLDSMNPTGAQPALNYIIAEPFVATRSNTRLEPPAPFRKYPSVRCGYATCLVRDAV